MIKSITKIGTYRDGGTHVVEVVFEDTKTRELYIDNRIGSLTKGEVYDNYPGRESKPSELSADVKEFIKNNPI